MRNKMPLIIAPSLLSADFSSLKSQIELIDAAGADWHHLDVMDGRFVPNITFGPLIVKTVRRLTDKPLDVHLMIIQPEKYIPAFRSAGADWITVHCETVDDLPALSNMIRTSGAKPGLSLNPETALEKVTPYLKLFDLVLIMSVHPGFGGQVFIPDSLKKVSALNDLRHSQKLDFLISIDGGINPSNARAIHQAGADILVAGSSIYHAPEPAAALKNLRAAALNSKI